jgi:hypothetical protein
MVWQVVNGLAAGAFSGLATALLGYAKSSKTESFNINKAVQTMIVGAIVGAISGFLGVPFTQAYEYLSSVGAITLIEYIKKAVLRRLIQSKEEEAGEQS